MKYSYVDPQNKKIEKMLLRSFSKKIIVAVACTGIWQLSLRMSPLDHFRVFCLLDPDPHTVFHAYPYP